MFWMSDIVRGKTRPPRRLSAAYPGVNLTPRTVLSISPGSSPRLLSSSTSLAAPSPRLQSSTSFGLKDVSGLLRGWGTDTRCRRGGRDDNNSTENDGSDDRQRRSGTDGRISQRKIAAARFLGGRQKQQQDFSAEDRSSSKMSRNIERPSPKTYHITTLHNTAFYVTHDTFIGELFHLKLPNIATILGFSGGTKGDGEVKRNWKPR